MEICKKIFFSSIFLIFFFIPNTKANNLNNINLTLKDLILMKYEIFFLKNQSRVTSSKRAGLMVRYQSINYNVNIDSENNTIIKINAIMDKNLLKYLSTAPVLITAWMSFTAAFIIEIQRYMPDTLSFAAY